MDDFLILCKTRWQLKRAVKKLNQYFHHYGFNQHLDKTFIGRLSKGFDWLGYQYAETGIIGISPDHIKTLFVNSTGFMSKPKKEGSPKTPFNYGWMSIKTLVWSFRIEPLLTITLVFLLMVKTVCFVGILCSA